MLKVLRIDVFCITPLKEYPLNTWFSVDNYGRPLMYAIIMLPVRYPQFLDMFIRYQYQIGSQITIIFYGIKDMLKSEF